MNREKEVIERLQFVYTQSQRDINAKIKNLEFSIGKLKTEYDWLDSDDPEKARVKSMIQSKIYQKNFQEQLKGQIDGILSKMQAQDYATISEYLDDCYNDGFIGAIFDQHGQGVPFTVPIDQEAMVRAVQLDSKISQGLYTRLGEDVDLLKARITAQISRAISTGMTYGQTARLLAGQTNIGFNRAARIARTEGHRIQNQATMDAAIEAQDRGAEIVKQWDATLDAKTRDSHAAIDMQIRELNKRFSNGLMFPGDPAGGAAEVVNCRCRLDQRARWALEGDFTKMNNFTKQIQYFESPEDYEEFKKGFFSKENRQYMNYVGDMEKKYGTKNFAKVLDKMDDREYNHYSKLLAGNPVYNKAKDEVLTNISENRIMKINLQRFAEKDIKKQRTAALKKGIRSYEKQIAEHKKKLENPAAFVEGWNGRDVREQDGLKRHWEKEIKVFQKSINDRVTELKARGVYDE